jgi:hypothetical protein
MLLVRLTRRKLDPGDVVDKDGYRLYPDPTELVIMDTSGDRGTPQKQQRLSVEVGRVYNHPCRPPSSYWHHIPARQHRPEVLLAISSNEYDRLDCLKLPPFQQGRRHVSIGEHEDMDMMPTSSIGGLFQRRAILLRLDR